MWIFTKIGFFSVSLAKKGKLSIPGTLQIRARDKQHLELLSNLITDTVGISPAPQILTSGSNRDYQYRMYISQELFAKSILPVLVSQIDYSNFKDAVHANSELQQVDVFSDALLQVWRVMALYGYFAS